MPPATADTPYALGATSAEHARLIRQAVIWDPFTERLFRDAGIGPGQRVLDIGSGVGDVAMLAARLVGPSGAVIGVERDPATIATARSRVAKAALSNVSFIECDVRGVPSSELFDAVVGRAILQYLPEAGALLRSLATLVRPGGVVAFQDVWPTSLFHLTANLPLRSKCASLIYRTLERSGVHMEMELVLYRAFLEAGLVAPKSALRFRSATIRTSRAVSDKKRTSPRVVVALRDEEPIQIFQQLAGGHPSGRDDVRAVPVVAAQRRGSAGRARDRHQP
jgi:ubiquinone/menaquinone biosynthesis C-methylase UbiE